jgi:hypothetical protein
VQILGRTFYENPIRILAHFLACNIFRPFTEQIKEQKNRADYSRGLALHRGKELPSQRASAGQSFGLQPSEQSGMSSIVLLKTQDSRRILTSLSSLEISRDRFGIGGTRQERKLLSWRLCHGSTPSSFDCRWASVGARRPLLTSDLEPVCSSWWRSTLESA